MNKSTILLTGATGFLGSHLVKQLISMNYNVIIIKRSFSNTFRIADSLDFIKYYDSDMVNLSRIFDENQIDIILHAATDYGRKNTNTLDIVSTNLMFPLQLLFLGLQSGTLQAFINTDTIVDKRSHDYGLSKQQFRDWLHVCKKHVKCINVSLEHFYGFKDDRSKFVSKMIGMMLDNEPQIDLTPGAQLRDFVYIDDVVDGLMTILSNLDKINNSYSNFDIGSGQNISIRECVESIKCISGNTTTKLNFGALPYREYELMESHADISQLQQFGWTPKVTFDEGIRKVISMEKGLR